MNNTSHLLMLELSYRPIPLIRNDSDSWIPVVKWASLPLLADVQTSD